MFFAISFSPITMAALSLMIGVIITSLFSVAAYAYGLHTKTLIGARQSAFLWGFILWGSAALITYLPLALFLFIQGLSGFVELYQKVRPIAFLAFLAISFVAEAIRYGSILKGAKEQTSTQLLTLKAGLGWTTGEILGRFLLPPLITGGTDSPLQFTSYYFILLAVVIAHMSFTLAAYHAPYSSKFLISGMFLRFFFELTYIGSIATKGYDEAVFPIFSQALLILSLTLVIHLAKRESPYPLDHKEKNNPSTPN